MPITWTARPQLEPGALVAALQGWNDGANAATDAVRWLLSRFDASECAALDPEEYIDFQASRPTVELVNGALRNIEWPSISFSTATAGGHDLLLLLGVEPNLRWRTFCDDVLEAARRTGC